MDTVSINEYEAEDFEKFYRPDIIKKYFETSTHFNITNKYFDIPDMGFAGGITFYENQICLDRIKGKMSRRIKIGCDYNHSWDADRGYIDDYESVKNDAIRLINKYLDNGYKISKDATNDK